jgi:hypothetical protein
MRPIYGITAAEGKVKRAREDKVKTAILCFIPYFLYRTCIINVKSYNANCFFFPLCAHKYFCLLQMDTLFNAHSLFGYG